MSTDRTKWGNFLVRLPAAHTAEAVHASGAGAQRVAPDQKVRERNLGFFPTTAFFGFFQFVHDVFNLVSKVCGLVNCKNIFYASDM